VGSAQGRIDNFIKSVPATGRALIEKRGNITLTIVNPDQYRDQIVKLIAAEALKCGGIRTRLWGRCCRAQRAVDLGAGERDRGVSLYPVSLHDKAQVKGPTGVAGEPLVLGNVRAGRAAP